MLPEFLERVKRITKENIGWRVYLSVLEENDQDKDMSIGVFLDGAGGKIGGGIALNSKKHLSKDLDTVFGALEYIIKRWEPDVERLLESKRNVT